MGQGKPFVWQSHWKQLGWVRKLGGVGPHGITRVGQTVWARLMDSLYGARLLAVWLCLWGGLRKGTVASANTSVWEKVAPQVLPWCQKIHFLPTCLVPFELLPRCWSSEGVSLSKSLCRPFKRNCLGIRHCFLQPADMVTYHPGTRTLGWGAWCGPGTLCSLDISPDFYPPHVNVGPAVLCLSYQSQCSFFFNSVFLGLPFSSISDGSEWWLFHSLVVILMLDEEVSCVYLHCHLDWKSGF